MTEQFYPHPRLEPLLVQVMTDMMNAEVGDFIDYNGHLERRTKVHINDFQSKYVVLKLSRWHSVNITQKTKNPDDFFISIFCEFWVQKDAEGNIRKRLRYKGHSSIKQETGRRTIYIFDNNESRSGGQDRQYQGSNYDGPEVEDDSDLY